MVLVVCTNREVSSSVFRYAFVTIAIRPETSVCHGFSSVSCYTYFCKNVRTISGGQIPYSVQILFEALFFFFFPFSFFFLFLLFFFFPPLFFFFSLSLRVEIREKNAVKIVCGYGR